MCMWRCSKVYGEMSQGGWGDVPMYIGRYHKVYGEMAYCV